jgi:hypothetical protein
MFASAFSTGVGYVGQAGGFASRQFHRGAGYMGGNLTGMSAATGAVGGGIYGGTIGRDYGQSRLGGAFTGALGGAALGAGGYHYGGVAKANRGVRLGMKIARNANQSPAARRAGASLAARSAGRSAFRQMKDDAIGAYDYIGKTLQGNGAFRNVGSTLKAGYNKRR